MINVNTEQIRRHINNLNTYKRSSIRTIYSEINERHSLIQFKLNKLIAFLNEEVVLLEQNERSLQFKPGRLQITHKENINLVSIFQKKEIPSRFEVSLKYAMQESKIAFQNEWLRSNLQLNLGEVKACTKAKCIWFKDKKINPDILLNLSTAASVASADLNARIGGKKLNANINAIGAVGTVYADCTCILNKKEQSFKAAVGAAALRGEASICFNIFGVKVTLTGEGSVLSAEANIEYKHASREWMFGSKLGFIAGLGFKIRVNY